MFSIHLVFSSPPQRPMTSDFEGFSIPAFIHWERASIFPFECWVLNKDTTGTIFITSLVWRGPWLGIEPRTSHTRSQHYTTRLSRRQSKRCKTAYHVEIPLFYAVAELRFDSVQCSCSVIHLSVLPHHWWQLHTLKHLYRLFKGTAVMISLKIN